MAWNRLVLADKTEQTWPMQNVRIYDDKVLLKEIGYTLVKKIGHGSFSKVWKARNATSDQDIAIKIIRKRKASKEFLEKFLPRELTVIQKVKHMHLLKYFEITDSPNSVYIVMQFAENGTLAELIEQQKHLEEDTAKAFFYQLIDVVEFLHRNGIVHRDIKCENLLLDKSYKLLLSDFGFARADVLSSSDGRVQRSRTYCGSYAYASPEILANTPYNPFMADVWCMGMVLYQMLVGSIPYKQTDLKLLVSAKKRPPQFPAEPVVTEASQNFIKRMLTLEVNRASIPMLRKDAWMSAKIKFKGTIAIKKTADATTAGPSTVVDSPVEQVIKSISPTTRRSISSRDEDASNEKETP